MNPQKALGAELLAALGIASVGAGKFPAPSRFSGIFLAWFVLGLIAQLGTQLARVATALGALIVLTMAMGQAGKRVFAWLNSASSRLGAGTVPAGAEPSTGAISGIFTAAGQIASRPRPTRR